MKLNVDTLIEGNDVFRSFFADSLKEYKRMTAKFEARHSEKVRLRTEDEKLSAVAEEILRTKKKRRNLSLDFQFSLNEAKPYCITGAEKKKTVKPKRKSISIEFEKTQKKKEIHYSVESVNVCLAKTLSGWSKTKKDRHKRFDSGSFNLPLVNGFT